MSLDLFPFVFPDPRRLFLPHLFPRSSFSSSIISSLSPSLPPPLSLSLFLLQLLCLSYLFLAISFFPFFRLFPNCLSPSRPAERRREKSDADNDLMYGPVMSLVGGRTLPPFPPATKSRLHGSIGLPAKESRKCEIFAGKVYSTVSYVLSCIPFCI